METKTNGFEVKIDRTLITVPHLNSKLTFVHPPALANVYLNVADQLRSRKLRRSTLAETASLIYSAWQNPSGEYENKVLEFLRERHLWAFNKVLYVPRRGAFIKDDSGPDNVSMWENLEKVLMREDPEVRFVPFGYQTGNHTPSELEKNPFVQALVGKEGAEKLAYVASKYRDGTYLSGSEEIYDATQRTVTLGTGFESRNNTLYINTFLPDMPDDGRYRSAFGILEGGK